MEGFDLLSSPLGLLSPLSVHCTPSAPQTDVAVDLNSAKKKLEFQTASRQEEKKEKKARAESNRLSEKRYLGGNDLLYNVDGIYDKPRAQGAVGSDVVVRDLLWAMLGVAGPESCIGANGADESVVGAANTAAVKRVMPLCRAYAEIQYHLHGWIVSGKGTSIGHEAFAWAIESLIQDYRNSIVALDDEMQKSGYLMARVIHCSIVLSESILEIQSLTLDVAESNNGVASILSLLFERFQSSVSRKRREFYSWVLFGSAQAYFSRLNLWIGGGELKDPFDELCIFQKNETFEARIGTKFRPCFLTEKQVGLILAAGKHAHLLQRLNLEKNSDELLRKVESESICKIQPPLPEWAIESRIEWDEALRSLHSSLGARVLFELRRNERLNLGLLSIQQSSLFLGGFGRLNLASGLLEQNALDSSAIELRDWIEGSTSAAVDVSLVGLSVAEHRALFISRAGEWRLDNSMAQLNLENVPNSKTVRDSLCVTTRPEWPVSLVVSPAASLAYALAFRRIFQILNCEKMLNSVYWALSKLPLAPSPLVSPGLNVARMGLFILKSILRHFSNNCHGETWAKVLYCATTQDSIELDLLLAAHHSLLEAVLSHLFLCVHQDTSDALEVILDTCDAFSSFSLRLVDAGVSALRGKQFSAKCAQMSQLLAAGCASLVGALEFEDQPHWLLLRDELKELIRNE